jgi:arabinofuranan 3-O-arabinosyltransferase
MMLQHPGQIVRDTKLDLSVDPGRFLASVTHLWNAQAAFGTVPDQAYGYLFPMGPFYWVGAAFHVPVWIVQRTWLALLLTAAFWGAVKMAEAFRIGTPATRLAGGIAYALSPWILAQAHDTSYVLPAVFLPWVMVPLKRHVDGGLSARAAAARSGVAVLCMGGINASLTFAVLLLPVIWFVVQPRHRRPFKLFGLWCVAVFLATAWFVIPLVFQGRYGVNFLPYTETASATTGSTFLPEIFRGGGVWTSLSSGPFLWSPGGYLIETGPAVIFSSALVTGIGLYGLANRSMPDRRFFGLAVIAGTLLVCAGYNGHLGGPLASDYQSLLNGSLAVFRNVYKFQPVIVLPLCLGLSHALAQWAGALRGWHDSWSDSFAGVLALGVVVALGLSAAPIFVARIYPDGSFPKIPSYYQQAAGWLNARGATSTTLVVPGSDFTRATWGNPLDNPMQALLTVPWANRNNVPQGSIGNTEVLDALDKVFANGQPAPGMAAFLARAGVRYVLAENDLNPAYASQPTPALVRLVLSEEPGLRRVAEFGPVVRLADSGFVADNIFDPAGATARIPSLEIYRVVSPAALTPSATTYPANEGVTLSGGPQGLLALANTGQLNHEAVTLSGDALGPAFARTTWVDADTQQLRDTTFTRLYNNESNVLTPGEARQTGAVSNQFIVVPGIGHETVSRLSGNVSVSASSFGSALSSIPSDQPLSAFLADAGGASWVAQADDAAPWIEIRFAHAIPVGTVEVTPLVEPYNAFVSSIRISTAAGSVTRRLGPAQRPQSFAVPKADTGFVKISLEGVEQDRKGVRLSAGLHHIAIPGVNVTQTLVLPSDRPPHAASAPQFLFTSPIPDQFEYLRSPDDEAELDRTFTVPAPGATYLVGGTVTPLHAPALPAVDLSAPFSLACGSGPAITLDGNKFLTSVQGTVGDLFARRSMTLSLCSTPGGVVDLAAGSHTITTSDASGMFKVTQLAVSGSLLPLSTPRPPRSVSAGPSSDDTRLFTVSPGAAAIMNVKQNYNAGWVATVDGQTLRPIRLDGWQQGYLLPASASAQQVTLQFTPDPLFRELLLVGGLLALLLVIGAVVPVRRRGQPDDLDDPAMTTGESPAARRSRARHVARSTGTRLPTIAAWIVVIAAAVFLVAGPILAAVSMCLGVLCALIRRRGWLAWVALCAEAVAGLAIALGPGYRIGEFLGSGSYTAQALGAVALTALALSLLPVRRTRTPEGV